MPWNLRIPQVPAGLQQTLEIATEKRIKIVINGGAINPRGLAEETHKLVKEKALNLTVAYVNGDNIIHKAHRILADINSGALAHLDSHNENIHLAKDSLDFLDHPETIPVVYANAYLSYRAITAGLDQGADIIICGRVANAQTSRVLSAILQKPFSETFLRLSLSIVEIVSSDNYVVTKHEGLNAIITLDTGNLYLNSDIKADITHIKVKEETTNRVYVLGIKGYLPPATTKLAIFHKGAHFASIHCTLKIRTVITSTFLGFFPTKIRESKLTDAIDIFGRDSVQSPTRTIVSPPKSTEPLKDRDNYDAPRATSLASFGVTVNRPLGDLTLGRSGDKGGNVNIGLYVQTDEQWRWFRSFMTRAKLQELIGADWQD
ncbi:uncharacterized protein N7496_003094 [Penicillium cataractarum]|uniref:Acyclic terpene utilisation N-terminal domain-containing protein n=1 Tax=Penicillium cataractarum TaxID=2100454 RepID=A0A9W9VIH9_9EURO|nr:uncharacterized protein N7496_003094 [Penicillium cataractarum]KAJ5380666.1 hypothetical protein N7496_003094 [Penicillium cataractarum]